MKEAEITKRTNEIVKDLLGLLEIKARVSVSYTSEPEAVVSVFLNEVGESAGLLIGSKGQTLLSIQSFIAMSLRRHFDEQVRVSLDIGDWRKKQEDYLMELAEQAAQRVKDSKKPQYLYNLNPSQRRVIHVALSKKEGIVTESEGEGEGRYLVVKPA